MRLRGPPMSGRWPERIARIGFGAVVVPCFAGLALIAVLAREHPSPAQGRLPDLVLAAATLLFALIAAYGLDQLLAGLRPSRRRWFSGPERTLAGALRRMDGSRSVTVARLWGAPVRIHWSAIVGLLLIGGLLPGAWVGFLLVILTHELGHALLVRRFGHRIVGLSVHALGGECQWIGEPTPRHRALIAWGGVAGQAALLACAWGAAWAMPVLFTGWFGGPLWRALVQSNLAMAALNLLPVAPLDGAYAWRLLPLLNPSRPPPPRDAVDAVVQSALARAREGMER